MNEQRYALNEPTVASQLIDGETILIHFDQGRYFSVAGLGSELLQQLLERRSPEELAEVLAAQFAVERSVADDTVRRYVDELLAAGLIVRAAQPGAPPSSDAAFRFSSTAFAPPVLEAHTELEDLLRLDPIHDVGDAGWPSAPRAEE